ncbi:MAG: hypothetical protein WBB73_12535 [Candidatus Aminicenantaceae bacterium]
MKKNKPLSLRSTKKAPESEWGFSRGEKLVSLIALLLTICFGSIIRIHTALTDVNFNMHDSKPLLRSDPGLLYYFTQRIIESHNLPPNDFRADPLVEYPETSDLPAMFSIGQEFLVAWCYTLFGGRVPLHVLCIWVMGIFSSLAVVGIFGLTVELTRNMRLGNLAAAFFVIVIGNYRTIGFILIREDFSLPWFSIHLYLLARAFRLKTKLSFVLVALSLVMAASSWHAMSFFISLEVACFFLWFLRTGQNPLAATGAWLIPFSIVLLSLPIPVLRSKGFILSTPMLMLYCLLVSALLARKLSSAKLRILYAGLLLTLLVAAPLTAGFLDSRVQDYAHVFELMSAKIRFLGKIPQDPNQLSFDSRLLWQGPFRTADFYYYWAALGVGLILLPAVIGICIWGWFRGKGDPRIMLLFALFVSGSTVAYFVRRTIIMPALLLAVAAIVVLRMLPPIRLTKVLIVVGSVSQIIMFSMWISNHQITWYLPPDRNAHMAELIDWIERNIPEGEPIAADFVNGTAILAHLRHPILIQPKYETTRSRRRIEEFMMTFVHDSPDEFRKLLHRYRCKYLLVDRIWWKGSAYIACMNPAIGLAPPLNSCYSSLCSLDKDTIESVPGYRLLYRSPWGIRGDRYRLFIVD